MQLINLEIYNPTKTYLYPNMQIATPDRVGMEYAAVNVTKCVITTDSSGEMFYGIEPLNAMLQRLGVDASAMTTDEEKLVAMETILNTPPVDPGPSAEERMAAAMEYQNLLTL